MAIHFASNIIETRIQLTPFHYQVTLEIIALNDNCDAYVSDASDFEEETGMPAMPFTAIGILPHQFEHFDHRSLNETMPENSQMPDTADQ